MKKKKKKKKKKKNASAKGSSCVWAVDRPRLAIVEQLFGAVWIAEQGQLIVRVNEHAVGVPLRELEVLGCQQAQVHRLSPSKQNNITWLHVGLVQAL
jgi:hypothetical protein